MSGVEGEDPEFANAKDTMRKLFAELDFEQSKDLVKWAKDYLEITPDELRKTKDKTTIIKKKKQLHAISEHIKELGIVEPNHERIQLSWPKRGLDSDCNPQNTLEIDAFVYDDDDIEDLVENNVISRTYCEKCHSRKMVPLNFISHSLSREQIEFVFTKLMNNSPQQVLDIGSWIGAVVFGSAIFNDGNVKTVGVEMNKEFSTLSKEIAKKYKLKNLEIINEDIRHLDHVVKNSQFIIMNNVFAFFLSISEQQDCWEFLHTNMQPGTVLIHHPTVQEATDHLELSFKIDDWLSLEDTTVECIDFAGIDEDLYTEMSSIKRYVVKDHSI